MVVVVSVCKFPGGVFTSTPDSYFVNEKGEVECWNFKEWREALLSRHRGTFFAFNLKIADFTM